MSLEQKIEQVLPLTKPHFPELSGDWTVVGDRPKHVNTVLSPKGIENADAIYGEGQWDLHRNRNARVGYLVVKTARLEEMEHQQEQ